MAILLLHLFYGLLNGLLYGLLYGLDGANEKTALFGNLLP